MKKNELKKLVLSKETLFPMDRPELRKVAGGEGGWSDQSVCPTGPTRTDTRTKVTTH